MPVTYTTKPSAPSGTSLDTSTEGEITVSWTDNSSGEDGYRIYRSTDGSNFTQIADLSANTSSYSDTGLLDGEKYWYYVEAYANSSASAGSTVSGTTQLPFPTNPSATYVADDQIDISWTDEVNNGQYRIQLNRDGSGYTDPASASGPNYVSSGTTSATYTPDSDAAYDSMIGVDSSFVFRIRAETDHTSSPWVTSNTVYTSPIPPHNPSVSRPDANTIEITYSDQSDISSRVQVDYREDTGDGYGSWTRWGPANNNTLTATIGDPLQEDSRYQWRLRHIETNSNRTSEWVYADYGNAGNVFFSDDFESDDLSAWDSTNGGLPRTDTWGDTGVSGADEGTYYLAGKGVSSTDSTWIQKNLGDLSGETDVIVKCAFDVGSLDSSTENFGISWYDGSTWQPLKHFTWEYNRQDWFEVMVQVPDNWLSTDSRIRVGTTTSGGMYAGDHFAVDRVVVSDILHEYTKPAAPTNLRLDNSVEGEISYTFTDNMSIQEASRPFGDLYLNGSRIEKNITTSGTFSGLVDGEEYEIRTRTSPGQYRHGSINNWWSGIGPTATTVTRLPAPTSLSVSNIGPYTADLSWTDNADNEDAQRVYLEEAGNPTSMEFIESESDTINVGTQRQKAPLSVTAWIYIDSNDGDEIGVIGNYDGNGWIFRIRPAAGDALEFWMGNSYNTNNLTVLERDEWVHVGVVWDGSSLTFYKNGNSESVSVSNSITKTNNEHRLASRGDSDTYSNLTGRLRNVTIHNVSLTGTEVNNTMSGDIPPNGLVGYWPLDINNGGTTPDVSEFANDGDVNGPSLVGNTPTDMSGALAGGATSYNLGSLLNGERYETFVQTETEHSTTRDS